MLQHKVSIVTKKMPNLDELTKCGYVQQWKVQKYLVTLTRQVWEVWKMKVGKC